MKTKKEMREEYKRMKFPLGVFRIRNKVNNKIFIGSSTNLGAKWNSQQFQLNMGSHPNRELQKDWNEYGKENFVYEVLEELKPSEENNPILDREEVKTLEELLIEKYQPFGEKGYNRKIIK
jgi:group I intron endonuclease